MRGHAASPRLERRTRRGRFFAQVRASIRGRVRPQRRRRSGRPGRGLLEIWTSNARLAHTLKAYATDLTDASGFLAGRGRDLSDAVPEDLEAYFQALSARGLAASTAARRRAAVRQFYRFALGERWRADDPSRRVEAPKQGRPLPKVLSREEVERLIAAAAEKDGAQGLRLSAMVELLYASGLRISELLALRVAAVARDPAFLIVLGKGNKERLAP